MADEVHARDVFTGVHAGEHFRPFRNGLRSGQAESDQIAAEEK